MARLCIYVGEQLAGHLSGNASGYSFEYLSDYSGPPAFLGWDVGQSLREWDAFPPAFDGLLPEGVLLDQLLAKHKLDKADKWGQLLAVGLDLTGFVSVIPEGVETEPVGKVLPGKSPGKRVVINPPEGALPYEASELVAYHGKHKLKMSLSGMQPKVSAVFSRKEECFKVVESNGSYILKPSSQTFPGASENEALTMELARTAGLDVPLCGWLQAKDGSGVFWIERFDRWGAGNRNRVRCEDACQILELPSSWKYTGNLETLARMVRKHCSNPKLQLVKLFQRVLFCWITGNGDMHLKNWSLIEYGKLIELAPAYDLLNTKVLINDDDESALSLDDRKSDFNRKLLIDYFAQEVCGLNERMVAKTLDQMKAVEWEVFILGSQMDLESGQAYNSLIRERLGRLGLRPRH